MRGKLSDSVKGNEFVEMRFLHKPVPGTITYEVLIYQPVRLLDVIE